MNDLNELAQRVHQANIKWWQHPVTKEPIKRNKGELLMLVITELAEACEGERKDLMDDKLPHRKMAEVEMADAYIRLLDFAAGFKIHLIREDADFGRVKNDIPTNKGDALLTICQGIIYFYRRNYPLGFILQLIEDYCWLHNYDLMGAFEEKMAYNATRQDHTHEARQQVDGKKW